MCTLHLYFRQTFYSTCSEVYFIYVMNRKPPSTVYSLAQWTCFRKHGWIPTSEPCFSSLAGQNSVLVHSSQFLSLSVSLSEQLLLLMRCPSFCFLVFAASDLSSLHPHPDGLVFVVSSFLFTFRLPLSFSPLLDLPDYLNRYPGTHIFKLQYWLKKKSQLIHMLSDLVLGKNFAAGAKLMVVRPHPHFTSKILNLKIYESFWMKA